MTDLRVREEGFTMVEILVVMALSMIVLFATLQSFDVFTSSASQQSRATDANDQVRRTMERVVNDLRGASVIMRADATDLVYRVPDALGNRTERLCVSSGWLYGSSNTAAGIPSVPTAACDTGTKIASLQSTSDTAFTYDGASSSATPALVKNVGLTLSLDSSGGGRTASSTLKASAARRSAGSLPITDDDLDSDCNASGAFLSLSADVPNVGTMSVTYENDGGVAIGTPVTGGVQIPEGITHVVARVTDAAGVTNTIRKDVECSGT